jgi:hypothetical protein
MCGTKYVSLSVHFLLIINYLSDIRAYVAQVM